MPLTLPILAVVAALTPPAEACSPDEVRVQWIQPAAGAVQVPPDAVIRVLVGDGVSAQDAVSVRLVKNGVEVAAGTVREDWDGDSLADERQLLTLTPTEELLPGGTYKVEVSHSAGADYGDAATFTVGSAPAAGISGVGEVEVRSAADEAGAGEAACDWAQVRTFQLDVEPARAAPEGMDVVMVYRTKALEDTWHLVEVVEVDAGGSAQALTIRGDQARDWGSCFLVVQRGADGTESEPSALGCAPEPLQPDDGGDDSGRPARQEVDESCRGCAAGAPGGAAVGLGLALVGVARRRRARGPG
ncbi:Ig-like domain-containing protein [Myxococcota bacterium]|nr:Ig-like domain-containing protein [Myxococcota bacterium]